MADNTINVRIKDRSDTEANWTSKNPVLLKGERAITDGTGKYKIGDGKNTWGALPYYEAMTSADRSKLNGIASGANKTTVDSSLSSSSTNPVQNKVVNSALAGKSNTNHTHDLSTMINTLSTGGSTPTDEDYFVSQYAGGGTTTTTYHRRPVKALLEYIKGKLAKVAISGSYNDLSNKPTIPSVGNGTITIKQAGAVKGSFTTNQSGATTIELTDNNTNTWRGIQDNLTSTSTTDSLSANQGKILNESKLMHKTINTSKTDLNTLTETGIYHIVITGALNAPTSNHGTLYVDTTVGTKYQVFMSDNVTNYMHKRYYDNANKEWLGWIQLKFTDTVYTHPSYTAKSNGLYKVTVDDKGHVSGTTAVAKSDITALGIPSTNTTYSTGTASTSGLTKLYTGTGTATDGTMTQSAIKSVLDGKSNNGHTHDDRYYTESEMNTKLSGKSDTSHTHSQYYDSSISRTANTILAAPNGSNGAASFRKLVASDLPSHTHNYAGSSSAGGSANSAVKLATERTVSNTEDFVMSFSYDGSANSNASLRYYNSRISVGNTNNYPYHRFAKIDTQTSSYIDKTSTFLITQDYNGGGWGIVRISLRTNNSPSVSTVEAKWLVRCGLDVDCIQIGLYNVFGKTYADAFFKTSETYAGTVIRNLASGARGTISRTWILTDSAEANSTTISDKKTSTESYASTSAAATTLHSQAYTSVVVASDGGTVSYANSAGNASKVNNHTVNSDVPSGAKFTDTVYSHPTYTAKSNGLYKVTVDGTGHVSGVSSVTKADITNLGIPGSDTNTTYPMYTRTINANYSSQFRSQTKGDTNAGGFIAAIRNDTANVAGSPQYGSGMAWGMSDTHGYLYCNYSSAEAYLGAGNGNALNWKKQIAFTDNIPSVGNGTVTIKQGGTSKGSFTMNQSGNTTIELTDNNTTYTLSSITGTLAVSKGGTGSTTAAGGRSNLGAVGFVCQSTEPSGQNNGDLWFKEE